MKLKDLKIGQSFVFSSEVDAITYEEYKKLHPATKKTKNDPLFQTQQKPQVEKVQKPKEPTESEKKSVRLYSGSLSSQFIDADKGKTVSEEVKKHNDELNAFLAKAPKYHGTIHRGIVVPKEDVEKLLEKYKEGSVVETDSKQSWTKNPDSVSNRLASISKETKNPVKIFFEYPESKKGVDISNLSRFEEEQEVLIPKGENYSVKGVEKTKDGYKIIMQN